MTQRVLSFGAHPDDIEFGCGGTEALLAQTGYHITHAVLSSGEAGHSKTKPAVLAKTREKEARASARALGAHAVQFLCYPDGLTHYTREMKVEIVTLIRRIRPDIVFVHSEQDRFPDHRIFHSLVRDALIAASGPWYQEVRGVPHRVRNIYGYEVWHPISEAQSLVDISTVIETKLAALRCHRSQIQSVRYDEACLGLARYRGTLSMLSDYAEAFEVIKTEVFPASPNQPRENNNETKRKRDNK